MNVLLIEDDPDDQRTVRDYLAELHSRSLSLEIRDSLSAGLERLSAGGIGAVLLDLFLSDSDGLETFRRTQAHCPKVPIVVLTGLDDEDLATLAVRGGAQDYLRKENLSADLLTRALLNAAERKQTEERLRQNEERLQRMLGFTAEGVCEVDREGNCVYCNPACVRLLGRAAPEELLGKNIHLLMHYKRPDGRPYPREECPSHRALLTGESAHLLDETLWRSDGSCFPAEYWAYPLQTDGTITGAVIAFLDLTERRHLEAQLRQAQRMEAIGCLAGGIAHDFNNLLGVILGFSEILQDCGLPGGAASRALEHIKKAAESASALTRQLLAFSRHQILEPVVLSLGEVVAKEEPWLRRLIRENIELVIQTEKELGCVRADPGQVEQVIMNLAVNARDAMPRGGRLTIETRNQDVDRADSGGSPSPGPEPGRYVTLVVRDTGIGMDAKTLERIFEPFFTTKTGGTGMGLASVGEIVKQSGGRILVDSEPGRGTTFSVFLPRVQELAEEHASGDAPARALGGSETILLVEDDDGLRAVVREFLAGAGYTVLAAASPDRAVECAARRGREIDLLLTDLIMPSGSGRELAERLKSVQKETSVLYMSGYTDDSILHQGVLASEVVLLPKPFTRDQLLGKVRDVLDGRSCPQPASPSD